MNAGTSQILLVRDLMHMLEGKEHTRLITNFIIEESIMIWESEQMR